MNHCSWLPSHSKNDPRDRENGALRRRLQEKRQQKMNVRPLRTAPKAHQLQIDSNSELPGVHYWLPEWPSTSHACRGSSLHAILDNLPSHLAVRNHDTTHGNSWKRQVLWSKADHRYSQQRSPTHTSTVFMSFVTHFSDRRYPLDTNRCAMLPPCCIFLQNAPILSSPSTASLLRKFLSPSLLSIFSAANLVWLPVDKPTSCTRCI